VQQGGLRGAVGAEAGRRREAAVGRDVHDRARAALGHPSPERAREQEGPGQVRVEDLAPGGELELEERRHHRVRGGVVHEHVHAQRARVELVDERRERRLLAGVRANHLRAPPERRNLARHGLERLAPPRHQHHVRSVLRQPERDRAPDAARCAGHERRPALEPEPLPDHATPPISREMAAQSSGFHPSQRGGFC
jgi:hypothetical protein